MNEKEPLTIPLYASRSLLDELEPYEREQRYNDISPAVEAVHISELKVLPDFEVSAKGQIYNATNPARDVGCNEFKQLYHDINPPGDAVIAYHTSHEFKELLAFNEPPPEKQMFHDANPPGDLGDIYYVLAKFKVPGYYFEWRMKVHYYAGPVLETGDLQQAPSLQEGELVLVPVGPVHHAGPVLA